jgi:hypothetical protein
MPKFGLDLNLNPKIKEFEIGQDLNINPKIEESEIWPRP